MIENLQFDPQNYGDDSFYDEIPKRSNSINMTRKTAKIRNSEISDEQFQNSENSIPSSVQSESDSEMTGKI